MVHPTPDILFHVLGSLRKISLRQINRSIWPVYARMIEYHSFFGNCTPMTSVFALTPKVLRNLCKLIADMNIDYYTKECNDNSKHTDKSS